ncbi:MAG: hypothetical protein A2W93_14955 [Bacteroidetes bacterium GWF2_43_63]|nr:MAG: hypothetical protein A2W94_01525 [Bacteroidetes bacterium GWE2_42_42]OFY52636.1 MAG: hypothetical protein A2W93_14955 [Bacteroidetes bacterium GWF2_43_63]
MSFWPLAAEGCTSINVAKTTEAKSAIYFIDFFFKCINVFVAGMSRAKNKSQNFIKMEAVTLEGFQTLRGLVYQIAEFLYF